MKKASVEIKRMVAQSVEDIKHKVKSRSYRAAVKIRNASNEVLSGTRSGKTYRMPNSKSTYQASAPGEPPAVRTGHFRQSWSEKVYAEETAKGITVHSAIESNQKVGKGYLLGAILEGGTKKGKKRLMKPRPYQKRVKEKALPEIKSIYKAPY